MLTEDIPGLAEVACLTGAGQSPSKLSVLNLSGYICENPAFWLPGLTLNIAISLWKHSIHRSENQSQREKCRHLSIRSRRLDQRPTP